MLNCLYFGLFVLAVIFLVPQGGKLIRSSKMQNGYKGILLAVYGSVVLWLTLANRLELDVSRVRWEPFYVVRLLINCALHTKKFPSYVCKNVLRNSKNLFDSVHATPIEDLLLNIILFLPLGFLLPYIWPKLNGWKTVLIGFGCSILIETTQYVFHWGCLDVDDVFNNTLGACLGYLCYALYKKSTANRK